MLIGEQDLKFYRQFHLRGNWALSSDVIRSPRIIPEQLYRTLEHYAKVYEAGIQNIFGVQIETLTDSKAIFPKVSPGFCYVKLPDSNDTPQKECIRFYIGYSHFDDAINQVGEILEFLSTAHINADLKILTDIEEYPRSDAITIYVTAIPGDNSAFIEAIGRFGTLGQVSHFAIPLGNSVGMAFEGNENYRGQGLSYGLFCAAELRKLSEQTSTDPSQILAQARSGVGAWIPQELQEKQDTASVNDNNLIQGFQNLITLNRSIRNESQ